MAWQVVVVMHCAECGATERVVSPVVAGQAIAGSGVDCCSTCDRIREYDGERLETCDDFVSFTLERVAEPAPEENAKTDFCVCGHTLGQHSYTTYDVSARCLVPDGCACLRFLTEAPPSA